MSRAASLGTPGGVSASRRNIAALALLEVAWGVGMGFVPFGTVVPFLLRGLGAGEFLIGSVATASLIMTAAPQLIAAYYAARFKRKIGLFVLVHYPACISVLAMGAVAFYAHAIGEGLAAWLIVACVGVYGLSMGMVTPIWVHLMAKLLPSRIRNTLWAWIVCAGTGAGLVGAWQSHTILGENPSLVGYAVCLTIGGVLLTLAIQVTWLVREPEEDAAPPQGSALSFVRRHIGIIWASRPMRRLIPLRMLAAGGTAMLTAFLAAAARDQFDLPDKQAAVFTAATIASQIIHGLWSGPVGDRLGNKVVTVLAPVLVCMAAALALVAKSPTYFTVTFLLTGGIWILDVIAVNGLVMAYCPAADNTPAVAATATCVMPVAAIAPLIGGWLARASGGYDAVFVAAGLLTGLAAILMAVQLEEPRRSVSGAR